MSWPGNISVRLFVLQKRQESSHVHLWQKTGEETSARVLKADYTESVRRRTDWPI